MISRSVMPAGIAGDVGRKFAEMHPALAADLLEPFEFGQRIGVVVDAQVELRPLLVAIDQ